MGLTEADLSKPGIGLQIGVEPGRIDVLTKISGIAFAEAWPGTNPSGLRRRGTLQRHRPFGALESQDSRGRSARRVVLLSSSRRIASKGCPGALLLADVHLDIYQQT